ncbi:Ger(x)C family spore germination protein [Paenibacillus lignilyticus]|uniref:Ger(X)C family spore germination protein n=1 Tax=Paenibacillus lignilyticus TaxID=1172615 RepID=A0ABS5CAJ1_9BACL|nr:Ger(x)C family spore germination protein [Paenibacillus lignilyticus]MBP3962712.1 Ger(x)C family spore germination protein [Paenibacillus lignilyticus]
MSQNPWIRSVKTLLVMVLTVPLLSGCWDRLEIEERAVVLGISIDEAGKRTQEERESQVTQTAPQTDLVRVTVQIALPGRIPLGPGESGGSSGAGTQETLWVLDSVGHSVDDALMNLQQQLSSRLFFGHLRVIVVSESVARRGLENVNDFFHRNSEVRRLAWLMISEGNAKALMKAAPKLERVPTLYLMATLDEGTRMGKFPSDYIGNFWSNSVKLGEEGFLPYVAIRKEQNVQIAGLAYFKGNKMVGHTNASQIGAYMGIKGINPAGYRIFVDLGGPKKNVMTTITHRDKKIVVRIVNGLPRFTIHIALEINVEEKLSEAVAIDDSSILKRIEQDEQEKAIQIYRKFLGQTQADGSDIFGFGEYVRAKKPGYWNSRVRTKERWQEMYKEVDFDLDVQINVRRVGMKSR